MSEPKLTEALAKALCDWWDDVECGDDPGHRDSYNAPCDRCRSEADALSPTLARMVAATDKAATTPATDVSPVAYAEQACSHLTDEQVADVRAYLVGVFSTYVDNPDASRISAARWRRFVAAAIEQATP